MTYMSPIEYCVEGPPYVELLHPYSLLAIDVEENI